MRRTTFALLLSGSMLAAAPTLAQTSTATPEENQGATGTLTDVVVTGSRVPGRTIADSPVPVDVIGGDALRTSGQTETNKVLNQLVPSFNFPQPSLTDGTDSLRPATLRGLAPDQTLVLVNGKRRHQAALVNINTSVGRGSTAVDLNEIPPIAIDRIEVLRDGASSQYGSDAIAGVINLQLSRRAGVSGSVTYGQYRTTMEDVFEVTGVGTTGGVPTVVGNIAGVDILQLNTGAERQRRDGETLTLATRLGLPIEGGHFVLSAQFRDRDPTNRSGPDPRRQYLSATNPSELTIDRFTHGYGDGKTVDYNLFLNAGAELGAVELYTFASYGIRDGVGAGFYRRAADARNRDFAASTTTVIPYYPNGFLPKIKSEIEDFSGAVGLKGDIAGLSADLSVVYGMNKLDYQTIDSFNTSLGGVLSPNRFDSGGLRYAQTTANLDLVKVFEVGFADKFGIAFGAEVRNENFRIRAGNVASYINGPFAANGAGGGAQVFPGFRPSNVVNESRDSYSVYAEADADVSDAFTIQAAGRFEHYTDFGDTLNGKLAARLEPIEGIAIRGSVATGFRAPSLQQQFFATTSTNSTVVGGVTQLIEVGTFPATSPVATALGGRQLRPEKALNLAGGVAFTPLPGLSITADYYNSRIKDRVLLTENLTGATVVGQLTAAGISNVTSARFFINGVDTRTQGVDIVGTYRTPDLGFGRVTLTAGYNYNQTKIIRRAILPSIVGVPLFGRTESYRLTDGQPRNKLNLSADLDAGMFGANIRTNRYGSVLSAANTGGTVSSTGAVTLAAFGSQPGDIKLRPKWITDIEVRVRALEQVTLAVGADNVFDVYPDRLPIANTGNGFTPNSFFLPYSSLSPFGFNGRFLYGRVTFDF